MKVTTRRTLISLTAVFVCVSASQSAWSYERRTKSYGNCRWHSTDLSRRMSARLQGEESQLQRLLERL